jgi:hypothetical protein
MGKSWQGKKRTEWAHHEHGIVTAWTRHGHGMSKVIYTGWQGNVIGMAWARHEHGMVRAGALHGQGKGTAWAQHEHSICTEL